MKLTSILQIFEPFSGGIQTVVPPLDDLTHPTKHWTFSHNLPQWTFEENHAEWDFAHNSPQWTLESNNST